MDTNKPTTGQGLTQVTATGGEPGLNCDRALISALFKPAAHNRDTTLEKQQDLSRLSQVRLHPAETWGSSTSYVSRLQTRGFTSHRFFGFIWMRCKSDVVWMSSTCVCVMCHAGSRPIAGLPAEHRAQEDERRVQKFWGDGAKVCLFYEGHFWLWATKRTKWRV